MVMGPNHFLWKVPCVEITLKPSSTLDRLYLFLPKKDLQKIIGERKVVIRDMIDNERYVGYNKNPYNYWDINLYA